MFLLAIVQLFVDCLLCEDTIIIPIIFYRKYFDFVCIRCSGQPLKWLPMIPDLWCLHHSVAPSQTLSGMVCMELEYGRTMISYNKEFSWPSSLVPGRKSQDQCLLFIVHLSDHTMIQANDLTLERPLDSFTMRASLIRKPSHVTTGVGLKAT